MAQNMTPGIHAHTHVHTHTCTHTMPHTRYACLQPTPPALVCVNSCAQPSAAMPAPTQRRKKLSGTGKASSFQHVAHKKGARCCIITVDDADDQLCLYHAVAIAKAHKQWSEAKENKKDKATIDSIYKVYKCLRRNYKGAQKRNFQELVGCTCSRHATSGATPGTLDDVLKFAHYVHRNIVALNINMRPHVPDTSSFKHAMCTTADGKRKCSTSSASTTRPSSP